MYALGKKHNEKIYLKAEILQLLHIKGILFRQISSDSLCATITCNAVALNH